MENREVTLFIDTSSNKEISVAVEVDAKKTDMRLVLDTKRAQVVLPLIEKLLTNQELTLKDITAISVNAGPGSFTGLRVGVSIANMLGEYLQIPINGQEIGKIVTPVYS